MGNAPKENKAFEFKVLNADDSDGTVEAVVSVFGVVDYGYDVIHNGAFTKTIHERGNSFKVLNNHNSDSVLSAIGKVVAIKEISKEELPLELLEKFPSATGGLFVKVKLLTETPEGFGVYQRLKTGAIDEWSIGYQALDYDFTEQTIAGRTEVIRNLRTIKLWEFSPVIFGMNPATMTTGVKHILNDGRDVSDNTNTPTKEQEDLARKKQALLERIKSINITGDSDEN